MRRFLLTAALLFTAPAIANDFEESPEVAAIFAKADISGTFVLYDATTERLTGFAAERARTRIIPASTFKIANSLIGLSSGAVANVDEVLPYGGQPQPFKAWEQDMGLREAIRASSVPIYQELARRIGLQRMQEGIRTLAYGNQEIGTRVDDFWLVGPLKISAVEQAQWLARLARSELPFPSEAQRQVREIVRLESGQGWTLYGKTGWNNSDQPNIGWWVGWVEQGEHLYTFALNIDMPAPATDLPRRLTVGKASLRTLGLLDGSAQAEERTR
ncbi:class D beta-lactamase [Stutzerimonas kirkiae]|uniref:class D beta-lactamase n=1 Tax=Stutzerimonas kirkiae TaxID=2211392 RepID=UPI001038415B|nr:class D beta-lactamase [Stutzerimonas kirkiae]TBV09590.1 class D beta-lactamase [Stutzerimonas kirkiae]